MMQPDSAKGRTETEPIAISALQHAVFCLRQAALIHVEQQWAENRLTAEGRVAHKTTSLPGQRHVRGVRRVHTLPLSSPALGIAGVADIVEFHKQPDGERAYPIEIKRGQPKSHRADEVQLCAQALCLEEMTGRPVVAGALYYAQTRRRLEVPIDEDLRILTLSTIAAFRTVIDMGQTPPANYRPDRCRACSLQELCQPKLGGRSVHAWRARQIADILADDLVMGAAR